MVIMLVARFIPVVSIALVKCERILRSWSQVVDAKGVRIIEFCKLFSYDIDRKMFKRKWYCRYFARFVSSV